MSGLAVEDCEESAGLAVDAWADFVRVSGWMPSADELLAAGPDFDWREREEYRVVLAHGIRSLLAAGVLRVALVPMDPTAFAAGAGGIHRRLSSTDASVASWRTRILDRMSERLSGRTPHEDRGLRCSVTADHLHFEHTATGLDSGDGQLDDETRGVVVDITSSRAVFGRL